MSKDNVVIEIGGMRYDVGVSELSCPLKNSGGSCIACKTQVPEVYAVCNEMGAVSCISATKIQPEPKPKPKMYFAWNRDEARHLVGKMVEYYTLAGWKSGKLESISNSIHPFNVEYTCDYQSIRELPTTKLTLSQLIEMAGIEGDVEIVEEDK